MDESNFDDEKIRIFKNYLEEKGWVFVSEDDRAYVMCKSGMKFSISKVSGKFALNESERCSFSVSMEFNAGTEDFCRRRMR